MKCEIRNTIKITRAKYEIRLKSHVKKYEIRLKSHVKNTKYD